MASNMIVIENTRFQFATNFAGDPAKGYMGSDQRCGNIIIPDEELAMEMRDEGVYVKLTKPSAKWLEEHNENEFVPEYFTKIIMNFNSKWPPRVFILKEDGTDETLTAETVGMIDDIWVDNVTVVLNKSRRDDGGVSLYVKSMEVTQKVDDDPVITRHRRRADMAERSRNLATDVRSEDADEEFIPFN